MENNSGELVFHSFPIEAQYSVINGIVATDVNGDGKQDLITAGNKYEVEIETTRADAGVGTLLLGGSSSVALRALASDESGLFLPDNVKGLYPIQLGDAGANGILIASNEGILRLLEW